MRYVAAILFLIVSVNLFSQDTTQVRGTIKAGKTGKQIYIKATASFGGYNVDKIAGKSRQYKLFQPFPVVNGYPYPFNYTKYYNDCFKTKEIDLKGKTIDTVTLEVTVLAKGKVYVKDKSETKLIKGTPVTYNREKDAWEVNNLHMYSMAVLKQIEKWIPAYAELPKKDKFRRQTVIKPEIVNLDCKGIITIYFSTEPL